MSTTMLRLMVAAALAAFTISGVGYATAGNDQGSGDQAWAQVNPNGGSPLLVKSMNFVSVASPSTGIYCLRPRPGVDLENSAPVAAQDQNLSNRLGIVTVRALNGTPNVSCPVSDLQVTTWDTLTPSTPTHVGGVAFDVVVP
jgi:hypothetical protein